MSHELYKKYRPSSLADMVGNQESVRVLQNFVDQKRVPHALMFSGPSGCGKTTFARILRKELDCGPHDWHEINSAGYGGKEMAREIMDQMRLRPLSGSCRIWLLDEFHKATPDCQEAMLKPLEDTPDHVYFFLGTTDPGKIKNAIHTRTTKIQVSPLSDKDMTTLLENVLEKEKRSLPKEVLSSVVQHSNGSPRTALVLLDKVIDLDEEELEWAVEEEASKQEETIALCRSLLKKDSWKRVRTILSNMEQDEESVRRAVLGYMSATLLRATDSATLQSASAVIEVFEEPFWNAGKPALVNACYRLS